MSDLKDHDPNEGKWITAFNLITGRVKVDPCPDLPASYQQGYRPVEADIGTIVRNYTALEELVVFLETRAALLDDNPNIVRGYN